MSTLLCLDSTTPAAIPAVAPAVLIYADGKFAWTEQQIALFPKAARRRISVLNQPRLAAVLDVERGDATPADAAGFIKARGQDACIYCSRDTLTQVLAETRGLDYRVWLATLDGTLPTALDGAPAGVTLAAVQFWNVPGRYDLSIVYDTAWLTA
jgi:hypothetical protein